MLSVGGVDDRRTREVGRDNVLGVQVDVLYPELELGAFHMYSERHIGGMRAKAGRVGGRPSLAADVRSDDGS